MMRFATRTFTRRSQAVIASLLVGLVLLLDALAASPALHARLHHDADQPGHQCAATTFMHGQVNSCVVDVPVTPPSAVVEFLPPVLISIPNTLVETLPPGRGPPVSLLAS
jgi:hypothetical protein